jgi:hypothetical protein
LKKVQGPAAVLWAAVLCAVLLAQTYVRAWRPNGIDLTSYLLSSDVLRHGGSPYLLPTPFPYLYPATLAFLLIPLTFVPATVAVIIWFAFSVAAAVWSIRSVVLNARSDLEPRSADLALFLAVFFTFFFTIAQSNLRNGQVNFLVLVLCVSAALSHARGGAEERQTDRKGGAAPAAMPGPPARQPRWGGVPSGLPRGISDSSRRLGGVLNAAAALGCPWGPGAREKKLAGTRAGLVGASSLCWSLAIALKLVPLILLPFFALRRSWRWMIVSVFLIVAWCLLPAVVVGTRIVDIYEQYWRVFLATSFAPRVQPLDFSLAGTIARITGAPLTPMLEASGAAVVLGWIIAVDGRRLRVETVRPLALYLLAIPLVSPQSEVHHLAFMLPAAAIVAGALWWDTRRVGRTQQLSAATAAMLYLAATATPLFSGPLFCASLIAVGVALMNVSPPGRLKPATTETKNDDGAPKVSGGVRL